ncbi:MAG: hypothetical protein KDA87_15640, partial [Planctomycetales bacterium]|nr:hypothetical protein [Planctomycetales bacterium]
MAVGDSYQRTGFIDVPDGVSGELFAVVTTGYRNGPFEFIYDNNNSKPSSINVALSASPDLQVSEVFAPLVANEGEGIDVTWTVVNEGDEFADGSWIDRVYLENTQTSDRTFLGSYQTTRSLRPGLSYSRTEHILLPPQLHGLFRVVVITNANAGVFEVDRQENNAKEAEFPLEVKIQPRPDLQVESIVAPDRIIPGGLVSVGFTVANRGTAEANGTWQDRVYLSLDNVFSRDDLLLASLRNGSAIDVNGDPYQSFTDAVQIPERYRNNVFILVVPDFDNQIDEWPNESNNVAAFKTFAEPLPLPDLVVGEIQAPSQVAAGTEFDVTYTVTNLGSGPTLVRTWVETLWLTRDRDRPHPGLGDILLKSVNRTRPELLARSAGFDVTEAVTIPDGIEPGNWFITPWIDPYNVVLEDTLVTNENPDDPNQLDNNNYKAKPIAVLVTEPDLEVVDVVVDSNGTGGETFHVSFRVENLGNGVAPKGYRDRVYLTDHEDPLDREANSILLAELMRSTDVAPQEGYSHDLEIGLSPSAEGKFIVVLTDTNFDVDESDEDNNRRLVETDVRTEPADLVISNVIFEPDNISGENTVIRYTVTNIGDYPVWSDTKYWKDFLWVSADPVFDRYRASYLGEHIHLNDRNLAPGESYEVIFNATWPKGSGGEYYLHIHLDAHNDLSPYFYKYESRILRTEWWPGNRGSNDSLVEYFQRWAFEDPRNNLHSQKVDIEYREPDLQVTELIIPPGAVSGSTLDVNYTVTNLGTRATRETAWTDRVFLSRDASLDNKDLFLGESSQSNILIPGESYSSDLQVSLPEGIEGTFYLLVYIDSPAYPERNQESDIGFDLIGVDFERPNPLAPWDLASNAARSLARGRVSEYQDEGNNLIVRELPIALSAPPDLRVTRVQVPSRAIQGQSLELTYTVTNRGNGDTPDSESSWRDLIYLSRDQSLDLQADRFLAYIDHRSGLGAGDSYSETISLDLPTDMLGAWYVIPVTDHTRYSPIGNVFENGRENNERASSLPVVIETPPPADLRVQGIDGVAIAEVGEEIQVSWTVRNSEMEPAVGSWSDSVYLSLDGIWDINDRLLGRVSHTGTLLPGNDYSSVLRANVPALTPGNYRYIVRTDIFNEVFEDQGDANNATVSQDIVAIVTSSPSVGPASVQSIRELVYGPELASASNALQLGVIATTTLSPGQERLFEVIAPAGETLRVSVEGGGDNAVHELYVRHQEAPYLNQFDATSELQLGSEPFAIIPSTKPGSYFILVRGRQEPAPDTPIQIIAEIVPLAISDVKTDVGGDSKYVTTTIRGARFHQDAVIKLVRPGFAEYAPVSWEVLDATTIKATFDFTGAPHGLYDVQVTNPDGNSAIVPYRFLVERAIEPDVTVGLGGPRIIMAGDTGLYSVAFQSLSNLDTPYTFFQIGIPEMGVNKDVYGLPFLTFASNLRGTPESDKLANIPWDNLNSAVNTNGQLLAPGYVLDLPADGFTGLSFITQTYPGLRELNDHVWEELKTKLYGAFPALEREGVLDDGPAGLDRIDPSIRLIWDAFGGVPDLLTKGFVPFQFHVTAAATALTREEFIDKAALEAERIRQGILRDDSGDVPAALLVMAADADAWREAYFEGLTVSGLLRPEDVPPPTRERIPLVSLMSSLGAGIIAGDASDSIDQDDITVFFDKLREWYGHDPELLAPIDPDAIGYSAPTFELLPPILSNANDTPAFQTVEDYLIEAFAQTYFETFRVYVPWVAWGARTSLPPDYLITGVTPDGDPQVSPLDLADYLTTPGNETGLVSQTGPFTAESRGFVPVAQDLPFTIQFQNDAASPTHTSEVRIVANFGEGLDPRSFRLGDLQIGDISIDLPEDLALYQEDRDFTRTRGFILRISAGVDLESRTANWLLQAIDPLTGELIQDPSRGLLPPNNARGDGSGTIGYTIRVLEDALTGSQVRTSARALLNNAPPEDSTPLRFLVDNQAPSSTLEVTQNDSTFTVSWDSTEPDEGSGFKHVTLYVSTDGGAYRVWERQIQGPVGTRVFLGEPGYTYEFLALATDSSGNREKPQVGRSVADDGGVVQGAAQSDANTDANYGLLIEPSPEPSPSALFTRAEQSIPSVPPPANQAEYGVVLQPFQARAFANGIPTSTSGIGPMAIVETNDDFFIISGGPARNLLFRVSNNGGDVGEPIARLDQPIFGLAFDVDGRLWATTGGGPLLELDPIDGSIVGRHGDGVTMSLAVHPYTGEIYVTTNRGIEVFNPDNATFRRFSRDLNLRFGSLAFDSTAQLWASTWPDRETIVRFNPRRRAEVMYRFDATVDSISFGKDDTDLQGLLFVSHNIAVDGSGGKLTMIDTATGRQLDAATRGTRGDVVITTSDGRVLVSQSHQVDVLTPHLAPTVIATSPPNDANVGLPLSLITVVFSDDMYVGDPNAPGSVLNPENYQLANSDGLEARILGVNYDPESRTAVLTVADVRESVYTLTVHETVESIGNVQLQTPFQSHFRTTSQFAPLVDIRFSRSRLNRSDTTVSYDV